MVLCSKLCYFLIIILIFNKFAISSNDEDFGAATLCRGNSTKGNSLYQKYDTSVLSLLSELALESNPPIQGFYNTTKGATRDKAYGYYICWGDISSKLCQTCVLYATQALAKQEIYQECSAFGYYLDSNSCLINYANQSVIEYKNNNVISMGNIGGKIANYSPYNKTLSTTIERLIKEAGFGNWSRTNFATRVVPVLGSNDKIHILVQCIPVLSAKNCSRCLGELYDYVPTHCNGTQGGVVVHSDCILKFNNQSFVGDDVYASSSSSTSYLHVLLPMLISFYFAICI